MYLFWDEKITLNYSVNLKHMYWEENFESILIRWKIRKSQFTASNPTCCMWFTYWLTFVFLENPSNILRLWNVLYLNIYIQHTWLLSHNIVLTFLLEKRDTRLQDFIKVNATFTFIDMRLQLAKL